MLREIQSIVSVLLGHEAAQKSRVRPFLRFLGWQMRKRLFLKPMVWSVYDNQASLMCHPSRSSSNAVVYFDYPDWHEMLFLSHILQPGDGFLDVGSNVGVYSVLAWSRVRPNGRIMAFEPDDATAAIWDENAQLNRMSGCQMIRKAVGSKAGEICFTQGLDAVNRISEEGERVVEMVALDDLIETPEDYVVAKVDVEGAEPGVLQGAVALMKAGYPKVWMLEVNQPDELRDILYEFGYDLYVAEDSGQQLRRIELLQPNQAIQNVFAIRDLEWIQARHPSLRILSNELS